MPYVASEAVPTNMEEVVAVLVIGGYRKESADQTQ